MLAIRERAAAPTTAPKHNRQLESYRDSVSGSRAKLQVGKLLLTLQAPLSQNQRKEYWVEFESRLRRYVDLKICEGTL